MKFYNIMLFLFIVNLFAGIIGQLGIFGASPGRIDKGVIAPGQVNETVNEVNTVPEEGGILGELNFLVQNVRLIVSGIGVFLKLAVDALLVKPILQNLLCLNVKCAGPLQDIINILSWLVRFVYVAGMVQLITGRNFKAVQ